MDSRSRFLIQILEKLGAPILAAVSEVCRREGGDSDKKEAERVAELLTKSVQAGIALGTAMDVKGSDAGADSQRLALTSLSAPMLSDIYATTGKMPSDADIRRLVASLQAALSFADNFAPSHENIGRLMGMNPKIALLDSMQIEMQYINALIPAIKAINAFSFGQPENRLAQDVAGRLSQRATVLRKSLVPESSGQPDEKLADIGILGALVFLYEAAHRAATEKLMAMNDSDRAKAAQTPDGIPSIETVWRSYEKAEAVLEAIGRYTAPASAGASQSSVAPAPVTSAPSPPLVVQTPPAPLAEQTAPSMQEPPASPMGFFAKKGDGQQTGTA